MGLLCRCCFLLFFCIFWLSISWTNIFVIIISIKIDPFLVFKYCRIPQRTNEDLCLASINILYLPIILNAIFSIWSMGNTANFYDFTEFSVLKNELNSYFERVASQDYISEFLHRSNKLQCYGFDAILILITIFLFTKYFFYQLLKKALRLCCGSKKALFCKANIVDDIPFYEC